jgi:uncharacterized protein (DUF58 family)
MSDTRRPVWFPRLTLRGGAFLLGGGVLLVDAVMIGRRDLLFVACLLVAVPVTALVYVAIRPVRLRVTRAFRPPMVVAGGETVAQLTVRNLSGRPLYGMRWRDSASPGITVPGSMMLPGLDPYEGGPATGADAARLEYTLTPRRRGLYSCGPLFLGRHDPFGLAFGEWALGEPQDLVVTPRITPLPGHRRSSTLDDGQVAERLRHTDHDSDELIAREYRPGDPLRRVNWPATARHGEIMVRQEEQRSNPGARIVLDTALRGRPAPAPGQGQGEERMRRHDQAFELAVELAASVGVHLLDAGFRLELVELAPSQLAPTQLTLSQPGAGQPENAGAHDRGGLRGDAAVVFRGPGGGQALLEALAGVVPAEEEDPGSASAALPRTAGYAPGGHVPTFAVLVDIDGQDARELEALTSRCRPAVAFVLDTMSRDAVDRLRNAGWQCIGLRTARDIPAAWEEITSGRAALHEAGRP